MEADFAVLDTEWLSEAPTVARALDYWDGRLDVREQFLEGIQDLKPPERLLDQHTTALDVFTRITAADEALAATVADWDTIDDHRQ